MSRDALVQHLRATLSIDWTALEGRSTPYTSEPLDTFVAQRMAQRPACYRHRFLAALTIVRAASGRLSEQLPRWYTTLTGDSARFRDAAARCAGRTYGWWPDQEAMFWCKINADEQDTAPPVAKAVRTYLDVIHFHPYPDANSRLALLVLEFFCRRHGVRPPSPDALRLLTQLPISSDNYLRLPGLTRAKSGHNQLA